MLFWIDATQPAPAPEIFGLSLLERQVRNISEMCSMSALAEKTLRQVSAREAQLAADLKRTLNPGGTTEIRIELPEGAQIPNLTISPGSHIRIAWSTSGKPLGARLRTAIEDAHGAPVIGMSADTEIDGRLITHFASRRVNRVFIAGEGDARCAAFAIHGALPDFDLAANDVLSIAQSLLHRGAAKEFSPEKFNGYIPKLRRTLAAYLFKITDAQARDKVERFLFESNYKGATDFMTKHVYPPLVWRMVKPLAQWRVQPNTVTVVSIIATFAAIPLFAAGAWVPGIALAFVMSVLDSVDGKLARVTFTSSPQGNLLDHGTDVIHPPLWYFGWAWGLSGGDPFSGVFQASIWMLGIYVVDRVLEQLFKVCTGRSIQDFRPIDVKLRTFSSRRNVNLVIFVVALPLGLGIPAFYAIVGWQALTAAYHLVRVLQFWDGNPDEQDSDLDENEEGLDAAAELSSLEAIN
ncbi:MAG: CDP-alcohol phosphatidyltransferase family protein [Deltaproteobacteria bacterium]|nr:CDP-alcohol phosphatidyltransferase family protein [Deltaproteobacteria bacterium]